MKRILFSIGDMEDAANGYCVSITTDETWKKDHCMDDDMSLYGEEANNKLAELGLIQLMDGCYEAAGWADREALRDALEHAGFVNDKEFEGWLGSMDEDG